jgi:DNA-binding Xre family transcriptional regulator
MDSQTALNAAFTELLNILLDQKNKKQDIAQKIGITPSYLSNIKNGVKPAQFDHIARMCIILDYFPLYNSKTNKFIFLPTNFL